MYTVTTFHVKIMKTDLINKQTMNLTLQKDFRVSIKGHDFLMEEECSGCADSFKMQQSMFQVPL